MTQARVVRIFLIGLPIGLLLSLAIAVPLYFHLEAKEAQRSTRLAVRKPVAIDDLREHVSVLAGRIGARHTGAPDKLRNAAKYLRSTLNNTGFTDRNLSRQSYDAGGVECHNIIVEIPGTDKERAREIIVAGAHYDSVPSTPGADDNASGTAALLSLAQAFAGSAPRRTLRFVFFVNEEPPYFQTELMGSLVYARACKAKNENIVAMLSLESLGYYSDAANSQTWPAGSGAGFPQTANFLAVAGNLTSGWLVERLREWFERSSTLPLVGAAMPQVAAEQGWSDHWSFWQCGYPAVMVTDTALFRNPHYHKSGDTPETLDYVRLTLAVKGLEGFLTELANASGQPVSPKTS